MAAAENFILWLTAPAQVKYFSLQTGDLPTRTSVASSPGFDQEMNAKLPGVSTFIQNLSNVRQARPQIPTYPKISTVLANMVVSVLVGSAQPKAALRNAAQKVDQILSSSAGG